MPEFLSVRPFAWADIPEITRIYGHYVETSTATFDTEQPTEARMGEKFAGMIGLGHPVLVAEREGRVAGYAYASTYRPRPAYRFTCEDTVYIAPNSVGQGVGSALLAELIDRSQAFGFRQMLGVITAGTDASIALHRKFGFRQVAEMPELGLKFDRWLGIVHMQRGL